MRFGCLSPVMALVAATLAAYASLAASADVFDTARQTGLRPRGPLPSKVTPIWPSSVDRVSIPFVRPSCTRTGPPVASITFGSFNPFQFDPINYNIGSEVEWCEGGDQLRLRLIRFNRIRRPNGTFFTQTVVLTASLESNFGGDHNRLIQRDCDEFDIFAEYCVRVRATGQVLCGTSRLERVPKRGVFEPDLAFRPPIRLELAPGDNARVVTRITGSSATDSTFGLQGVVENRAGNIIGRTPLRSPTNFVVIPVPLRRKQVGLMDNGTLIYSKYSLSSCPRNQESWRDEFATTVLVSRSTPRLVKQDVRLPTFVRPPVYPPTLVNEFTTLSVEAVNRGGGMREGGVPTKLTYQWYVRNFFSFFGPTSPDPVPGATGPTVRAQAVCQGLRCMRNGCFDQMIYTVDVCNTFGCRRSAPLVPNIKAPPLGPGERFDNFTCTVVRDS